MTTISTRLPSARRRRAAHGLSLVEVVVSIGMLTMVVTLGGSAIFQSLGTQRWWQDDSIATRDLRHAISWFSRDAAKAESVDLASGAGPVSSLAITWPDATGALQTSTYSRVGDTLTRATGGTEIIVARNVAEVRFNRSDKTLGIFLRVNLPSGSDRTQSLDVYASRLP